MPSAASTAWRTAVVAMGWRAFSRSDGKSGGVSWYSRPAWRSQGFSATTGNRIGTIGSTKWGRSSLILVPASEPTGRTGVSVATRQAAGNEVEADHVGSTRLKTERPAVWYWRCPNRPLTTEAADRSSGPVGGSIVPRPARRAPAGVPHDPERRRAVGRRRRRERLAHLREVAAGRSAIAGHRGRRTDGARPEDGPVHRRRGAGAGRSVGGRAGGPRRRR